MNDLPAWVTDPELGPLWAAARKRLEKNGLQTRGRLKVDTPTRELRHAVGTLMGVTVTSDSVTVELSALDARLRERVLAGGLIEVLTRLHGHPLTDRRAGRAARTASREAPLNLAAELVPTPWARTWIAGLRQTGLLTNRDDALQVVRDAATVLMQLTSTDAVPESRSRVELGAALLGDAHALDRDRLLHAVVVRGLAAAADVATPGSALDREHLWARFSVEQDLLSRTCLVWRVRADARRINSAADDGDPVHLTAWDLRRIGPLRAATPVLICENPRVLESLAENDITGWAAVCTSGEPNLVVNRVLGDLASSGACLYYHGDFDWPGVAIANRIMARVGADPWRFGVQEYLAAVRSHGPALIGVPVDPSWDPELGAAMSNHGRAVHEESVLPALLASMQ